MANEEHLAILKKGVEAWNEWRARFPKIRCDLKEGNFDGQDLSGIDLAHAWLQNSSFWRADLSGACVRSAHFEDSNLRSINLNGADASFGVFSMADLREATLVGARLVEATFYRANLERARLERASLMSSNLRGTNLTGASLQGAYFGAAVMGDTTWADVDLSVAEGLQVAWHSEPSTVGIDTVVKSKGKIPELFLRGAGVPEPFIVQMKALIGAMEPIQFYSCFISYSSKDGEFAERLHADLQSKGVRCWFAPEDLKIGDRIRPRIDEAIRVHDKLLLVLTESSVKSAWVEKEVETAFEKERISGGRLEAGGTKGRTVLFPIRLDDAVMDAEEAWAADIRRTRHIGDFRGWKEHDKYKKAFERLMRDLKSSGE